VELVKARNRGANDTSFSSSSSDLRVIHAGAAAQHYGRAQEMTAPPDRGRAAAGGPPAAADAPPDAPPPPTTPPPPERLDFPAFPYSPPYDIQLGFMRALYRALELGGVGLFESPTGARELRRRRRPPRDPTPRPRA
jgi:hypothetical protein